MLLFAATLLIAAMTHAADAPAGTLSAAALDTQFAAAKKSDWGQPSDPFPPILAALVGSHGNAAIRGDLERRLIGLLDASASVPAKDFACRQLAWIGTDRAIAPLAALSSDKQCSHSARLALERIPGAAATEALRKAASSLEGPPRVGAIGSLAARRDPQDISLFASLVKNSDAAVARAASAALGRYAEPPAADALWRVRSEAAAEARPAIDDALLRSAEQSLRAGQKEDAAAVYERFAAEPAEHLAMAGLAGLVAARPVDAPARLRAALCDASPRRRAHAARLIRESHCADTVRAVAACCEQLPPQGQVVLLDALGFRRDALGHDAIVRAAQSAREDTRIAAATALGAAGSKADVPRLAALMASPAATAQRNASYAALCNLRDRGADSAILEQLSHKEAAVRTRLIQALVERRCTCAAPALIAAAGDSDPEVRLAALEALAALPDATAASPLIAALARSTTPRVRQAGERAALACLLKMPEAPKRVELVLAAMKGAGTPRRAALLPLLGSLGGERAVAAVREARRDSSETIQEAAVAALANWPDASVAAELAEIARHGTTPSQRSTAIQGLARVAPRPGHLPPAIAFGYLEFALAAASSPEQKKFVLSRMAPVRTPECLEFLMKQIADPVFGETALRSAAAVAEGMQHAHPKLARPALETVLKAAKDEKLRAHVEVVLTRMQWQGK